MPFYLSRYPGASKARFYAGLGGSSFATDINLNYGGKTYPVYRPGTYTYEANKLFPERTFQAPSFGSKRFTVNRVAEGGPLNGYPAEQVGGYSDSLYSGQPNAFIRQSAQSRFIGTPSSIVSDSGLSSSIGYSSRFSQASESNLFSPRYSSYRYGPDVPRSSGFAQSGGAPPEPRVDLRGSVPNQVGIKTLTGLQRFGALAGAVAPTAYAASVLYDGSDDSSFRKTLVLGAYALSFSGGWKNARPPLPFQFEKSVPIPFTTKGLDGARTNDVNRKGNFVYGNKRIELDAAGNPAATSPSLSRRFSSGLQATSKALNFLLYADAVSGVAQGVFGSNSYGRELGARRAASIGAGLAASSVGALVGANFGGIIGAPLGPAGAALAAGLGGFAGGLAGYVGGSSAVNALPFSKSVVDYQRDVAQLASLRSSTNSFYGSQGAYGFNSDVESAIGRRTKISPLESGLRTAAQIASGIGDFFLGAGGPVLVGLRTAGGVEPFINREKQQGFLNDVALGFGNKNALQIGKTTGASIAANIESLVRNDTVKDFSSRYAQAEYLQTRSLGLTKDEIKARNIGAAGPLALEYVNRKSAENVTRRDIERQSRSLNEIIGSAGNFFFSGAANGYRGSKNFNEDTKRQFVERAVRSDVSKAEGLRSYNGFLADIGQSASSLFGGEGKNIFTAQYLAANNLRFEKSVTNATKGQLNHFASNVDYAGIDKTLTSFGVGKSPGFAQAAVLAGAGILKSDFSQRIETGKKVYQRRGGGDFAAYHEKLEREATVRSQRGAEAAKFSRDLGTVDFPVYARPQFDYRQYSSESPLTGTTSADEFRTQREQSYDKRAADYAGETKFDDEVDKAAQAQAKGIFEKRLTQIKKNLKTASTARERFDLESDLYHSTAAYESQSRELARPSKIRAAEYQKYLKDKGPSVEQDLSEERRRVLYNLPGDIRKINSDSNRLQIQGTDTERYQLTQNQQLGLISKENFIVHDYELERKRIGIQRGEAQSDINDKFKQLDNEFTYANANKNPLQRHQQQRLLEDKRKALGALQVQINNTFDGLEQTFSPANVTQLAQAQRGLTFTNKLAPFVQSFIGGAFTGVGVQQSAKSLGSGFLGTISGALNQQVGNYLAKQSTKLVPLGANVRTPADVIDILKQKFSGLSSLNSQQVVPGIGVGTVASQYALPALFPNSYYNRGSATFANLALGGAGAILGSKIPSIGTFKGGAIGSFLGGAVGLAGGSSRTGGALAGGLSGAAGGFAIGNAIAPGIGGLIGGGIGLLGGALSGFLGADSGVAKRQQALIAQQNQKYGQGLAKQNFALGNDLASDLFDGQGNFGQDLANLKAYHSDSKLKALLKANDPSLGGNENRDARNAFQDQYHQLSKAFKPVEALATKYASTLSRPGGLEGAIYDTTLKNAGTVASYNPFVAAPVNQLYGNFQSIQSDLAQYGTDSTRTGLAQQLFSNQYQGQLSTLNYQIQQGDRDFGFLVQNNQVNSLSRGIQKDQINRQVTNFDRDSQTQIEGALGTLQRRDNRSAVVSKLKEQQSFDKDILLRQQDVFNKSSTLAISQDNANQQDALTNLNQLQDSRTILIDNFNKLQPLVGSTADDFLRLSQVVQEVNRTLDTLNRNLR